MEPPPGRRNPQAFLALLGFLGLAGLVVASAAGSSAHAIAVVAVAPPMAVGGWRVWREAGIARRRHYRALRAWGWALLGLTGAALAAGFSPPVAASASAVALLLVGMTAVLFTRLDRLAAALLLPGVLWLSGQMLQAVRHLHG